LIAPVLSMFFLTSYGVLNISAAFEGLLASPSWRPTFKVKWPISLLGAICCFATMFMINAGATFMAASVSLGVFYYMQHKKMNAHWGDVSYGMMMFVAQKAIYSLATRRADERTWRPNILVLSGSPTTRWYLIELANAMSIGKGLLTVAAILPEDGIDSERRENMRTSIKGHLAKKGVPALVKIQAASDPIAGACSLVETYGFGPLRPNTFLLGETEKEENFINYAKLIKNVYDTRRNLVIVREGAEGTSSNIKRTIDVWWGRQRQNVGLMLALAHLLQSAPEWRRARLVLKSIVFKEDEKEEAVNRLQKFVENSRLKAEIAVIVKKEEEEVFETIRKSSRLVDLVFIGMRPPHTLKNLGEQADLGDSICEKEETLEEYAEYYSRLIERTNGYPPTAIVLATEDIEFTRIFE
ncbi:MAG: Na-K-Cl cotransporter, partial [Candidatus Lindowbacteria bacterium]|nr:Na-K-Cl cotransporter [Candidatus Lindowbacteria bacterium]